MNTWQAAWRITAYEYRIGWTGLIITLIFFSYIGIVDIPLLRGIMSGEITRDYAWIANLLYLAVIPNAGFLLHRSALHYWKDDIYTKKLAFWRTLPLSVRHIAAGRFLQLIVTMLPVWLYFFVLQYVLVFRELDAAAYLNFSLFWLGYAALTGVTYVILEQSLSGRAYLLSTMSYLILYIVLSIVLRLADVSIIPDLLHAAKNGNWLPSLIMLAAGVISLPAGKAVMQRRIARRNILG